MIVELLLFVVLLVMIKAFLSRHPPNLPPGPLKFPGIGSGMPTNEARCIKSQKKYGDVYIDQLGSRYWLTICDYKLAKECLSKIELSSRPTFKITEDMGGGQIRGIINSNGEHWKSNRRFILRHLRDLGMGKSSIEQSIENEASELLKILKSNAGEQVELPNATIKTAVLNVVWQMIASVRYKSEDPMLTKVLDIQQKFQKSSALIIGLEFFPIIEKLLPKFLLEIIFKKESVNEFLKELQDIVNPLLKDHEDKLDDDSPKDLMDAYLVDMKENKELLPEYACSEDLQMLLIDLFSAGSDTVTNMLRWTILYMAAYPEIQAKAQKEIDSVVPSNELPNSMHRARLPYCEAVLHEVFRKASLASFNVMRANSSDIELAGFHIPKETIISVATHFIHHDSRYWNEPREFNPMRFIDENGKFVPPKDGFLPFGLGRRQCVGEGLARVEYSNFSLALLQTFKFGPSPGETISLDADGNGLVGRIAKQQNISIQLRN